MAKITAAVQGETTAVQSLTFAVDNVPVYKSKATYTAHVGTAFSYPITTVYGYPVPTITTTSSLPGGVHLVDNGNGTGALTGTPGPMTGGIYTITVASTNGIGPAVDQTFTLVVYQAPAITSANNDTVATGVAMTPFTVTFTGYPLPKIRASGLPAGVALTNNLNNSGTIAGIPRSTDRTGAYNVTLSVSGKSGVTTQAFTLTVTP